MARLPGYEPMLATKWPAPFEDPEWRFEVKWDGIRCLLFCDGSEVTVRSRRGLDVTPRYPELAGYRAPRPCVLDGEIVALDESGHPSFGRLQQRMNLSGAERVRTAAAEVPVSFVVYDLLHDGVPLLDLPWEERRRRLAALPRPAPVALSEAVEHCGPLWSFVLERSLEGVVAKRRSGRYRPGVRSPDWRKVARTTRLQAVVGGFLPGERGRAATFGSLLLGLHTEGGLRWIGSVGTGFSDAALVAIREALDQMIIPRSPFVPDPALPAHAVFVAPTLVAVVKYKELTGAGRLRAPSFRGFSDADPAAVTWEAEVPTPFKDEGPDADQ